jgi:hypothetical protein
MVSPSPSHLCEKIMFETSKSKKFEVDGERGSSRG